MRYLFIFLMVFSVKSYSFDKPNIIKCTNGGTIRIQKNGLNKSFYKKSISSAVSEAPILEFLIGNKKVAKVYPQDGLDFVIVDKSYKAHSDNKTFWKLSSKSMDTVFSCELKYE